MNRLFLFLVFNLLAGALSAQEICDNGIDDDGDGFIDLNDPDCICYGVLTTAVTSLIPNPSFEDTLCCPSSVTQLNCAENWVQASEGTSDYFNLCGITNVWTLSQPELPLPGNGTGYAGFYNMKMPFSGDLYKEMIGACLVSPLEFGVSYRFSLYLARASVSVAPIEITVYGSPNCGDLPWRGVNCPIGSGSWIELGADIIEFTDDSWQHITIQFDAPEDIYALAIGGPCVDTNLGEYLNYYYIDELVVASAAEFDLNARITQSGRWCAGNLHLYADIDTIGGSWQWYRDGIALPGETANSLNPMVYGGPDIYTAVYTLGSDCISVEHSVEVESFHDIMPELISTPSCHGLSSGQAYFVTQPEDSMRFLYEWRAENDATLLSETDSLLGVPPGNYSVQVTVVGGCDTTVYVEIEEVDFRVSFVASDTIVCKEEVIEFTNTSDTNFTAFYWTFEGKDSFAGKNPPPQDYSDGGTYRVQLSGTGICMDTAYIAIVVDPPVIPYFEFYPQELCVGQTAIFVPHLDSSLQGFNTITRVQWTFADDQRAEVALQSNYQHSFHQSGFFPVKMELSTRACPDTSYIDSVRVYALPVVDLGPDSMICLNSQPIFLRNLRPGSADAYRLIWNTGDTTEVLRVVHPGTYTLSVTTEPTGCTTVESIEISKDCYIDIPNVFSPNGDGYNDYFLPRQLLSKSVVGFSMQVFNRWGQVVFETQQPDGRGWDGRFNGKAQPMGVYVYRIELNFGQDRRSEQYEGNVTLMR